MDKSALLDIALEKLMGDMDDLEGSGAMSHSAEDCPDPLGCDQHEAEHSANMTHDDGNPSLTIKVGHGLPPSLEDSKEGEIRPGAEEGLSEEEAAELKKLLSK